MRSERNNAPDRKQPFVEQVMTDLERYVPVLEEKALKRMTIGTKLVGVFHVEHSWWQDQSILFLGVSDSWMHVAPPLLLDHAFRVRSIEYWQALLYDFDVSPEDWKPKRMYGFESWESAVTGLQRNHGLVLHGIFRLGSAEIDLSRISRPTTLPRQVDDR